jgi:hypothetical protein
MKRTAFSSRRARAWRTTLSSLWIGMSITLCSQALAQQAPSAQSASEPPCKVLDPELASGGYTGRCANGLANDSQALVRPSQNGGASYLGALVNGRKQGQGTKRYANGDLYSGTWLADQRSGTGRYVYGADSPWQGDVYEGGWQADKMHGFGIYQWAHGDRYVGPWDNGIPQGPMTAGQARRAVYLERFLTDLSQTHGVVCSAPSQPRTDLQGARGEVRAQVGDRIQVELSNDRRTLWQLVSYWKPCK